MKGTHLTLRGDSSALSVSVTHEDSSIELRQVFSVAGSIFTHQVHTSVLERVIPTSFDDAIGEISDGSRNSMHDLGSLLDHPLRVIVADGTIVFWSNISEIVKVLPLGLS